MLRDSFRRLRGTARELDTKAESFDKTAFCSLTKRTPGTSPSVLCSVIRCAAPVERPVVRNSGPSLSPAMPAVRDVFVKEGFQLGDAGREPASELAVTIQRSIKRV